MAELAEVKSNKAAMAQLVGVVIGPLAWGADLLISYALVQHACSTGHHYILHVVSVIAFIVTLGGALLSWRQYQQVRQANDEGGSPFDRSHFLSLLGVASSLSFAIVIIAGAVPRWILSPCD